MASDEIVREWQWRRVGDPSSPSQLQAQAPFGELREAGATVTAYKADFPRLSLCPVCGQAPVGWVASMTLPDPAHAPLPLGRGCTPDHAAVGAPTRLAEVAQRVEGERTRPAAGDDLHSDS